MIGGYYNATNSVTAGTLYAQWTSAAITDTYIDDIIYADSTGGWSGWHSSPRRYPQTIIDKSLPPNRIPPTLEFNKYLNGSDLVEEFIKFLRKEGVNPNLILQMPMELFVRWLVVRAMEADGEPQETLQALPSPAPAAFLPKKPRARCFGCGQFMRAAPLLLHESCIQLFAERKNNAIDSGRVPSLVAGGRR